MVTSLMRKVVVCASLLLSLITPAAADDRTGVTENSIKIGLFGPLTGSANSLAKSVYGAAAVYKEVNENGGINGRKIELIMEDDGCNANKGLAAVKKLAFQDEVFLLHGAFCSPVALAVRQEIQKHPTLPFIVLGASNPAIASPVLPNLFLPTFTAKETDESLVEFILSKPGVKRIAYIRHTDEWGMGHFKPGFDKLAEHGITPVKIVDLDRGVTDATVQVLALKEAKPDAVIALLYPAELAVYLRDAYKYRLRATTVATAVTAIEETDKQVGIPAAMNDFYMAYALKDLITSQALEHYAHIFKKYYPTEAIDTYSLWTMAGA